MHASLLPLVALAGACATPPSAETAAVPRDRPYVLVLGTAQDAGLPQIACQEEHCRRARSDPRAGRLVTSLLLVDPRRGKRYLLDATPDLPAQVERSRGIPANRVLPGARPPLFDGIFLTHAHMGHYSGLLHLGPEAYGAQDLPVFVSARMAAYLRANGPWSLLVETGTIRLVELVPHEPLVLSDELTVTPIPVPHREEFSDTLAFRIDGPRRSLLYLPDIDKWERWDTPIEEAIAQVDVALLDGSFFDDGEVPGRDLAEIPHPFIVESLERLGALPLAERSKVHFTHLNHTNPACDPTSAASARIRAAGMRVASEGEILGL